MSQTRRPVLVVTGGSRGIGRAIAVLAARNGHDVAFTYRSNAEEAQAAAEEIESCGARALAIRADAGERDAIAAAFSEIARRHERIDALVNNAGIIGEPRAIEEADEDHLTEVFRANVLGVFFAVAEAIPLMSTKYRGEGGAIVNMSSAAARHGGLPKEAHYAASKGAIDSLTLALAKELPPQGIRVNALRPGVIETSIHEVHGGAEAIRKALPTIPLGRAGRVEEVAEAALFLAGRESSYINGAIVDVSGGR